MKKDSKVRLFEVMSRLDKNFKPKLNEDFEFGGNEETPEISGSEAPVEEKTVEQKYEELKAEVSKLYAMINGDEEEPNAEESGETENLQEWNFDKKKGETKAEKFEKDEKKETKAHEDSETPAEEEKEHKEKKELDEAKPKIPVAAIAKVGK